MSAKRELPEVLFCFARGRPESREAFCVDFDIAVQGESFPEVQHELEAAIDDYVEAAAQESGAEREKLLARRAPVWVVIAWSLRVLLSAWRHGKGGDYEATASFPVALAA